MNTIRTTILACTALVLGIAIPALNATDAAPALPAAYTVHLTIVKFDRASKKQVFDGWISTVSGKKAPLQVVDDIPYVASSSISLDASGKPMGKEKTKRAMVETGVVASVLPVTMPNGKVLIDLDVDQSSLVSMGKFTSASGNTIQLPQVAHLSFKDHAIVALGKPLTFKSADGEVTVTVSMQ